MYTSRGVVLGSQCDFSSNLSTIGALQIIQDHICIYFGSMGVDEIRLKRDFDAIWVFAKNKVRFLSPLGWDEKYKINCFISSLSSVRMVVDTAIYGKNDELKVYAKTEVCTLDLKSQRIKPIKSILTTELETKPSLIELAFDRFDDFEDLQIIKSHTVHSTSIDYCIHTNNIEYIRFVMDTFESKFLQEHPIKELQINYVAQTVENDVLDISRNMAQDVCFFEIKHEQTTAVRCKINF